jgi:hypothetical protein
MKKIIIFLITWLLHFSIVFAQKTEIITKESDTPPNMKFAYLGSIKYPGVKLGIEFPKSVKEKISTKRNGNTKSILKERFFTTNLSLYHHSTVHTNLMFLSEWQKRKTRKSGWFTEFAPGLGLSRTFLAGETYKQANNGEFEKVKLAGNSYFMLSLMGGVGYDFKVKKEKPIKLYFKSGMLFFGPYNSFILPRPTAEIGIITSLSKLKK